MSDDMSEHDLVRELLALAAAGALDEADQLRVERHVRGCENCRAEAGSWGAYSRGLRALPQPGIPEGLMQRTRAHVLQERAAMNERRWDDLVLAALALFAWTFSLSAWLLVRIFTGGALFILGTNFLRFATWSMVSTVLMWITVAAAAVVLGRRRREWRRV
jgi:anti-sigma factor RsiW